MESRFSPLYNTNHIPCDDGLAEIKEHLAPYKSRLAQLDLAIEAAQATITRLRTERKAIIKLMKPLTSLAPLVRRLPREIMERIFVHSLPANGYGTFNACESPLVLLRVCRRWRERALDAPELWSSIEIIIPVHLLSASQPPRPKHQQRVASLLEEVNRWLLRSANRPLSIRVPQCPEGGENILDKIYFILPQSSRQLGSCDLCLYPRTRIPSFNCLNANNLPVFRNLRLFNYPSIRGSDRFDYSGLLSAPNLKGLHLRMYGGQTHPYGFRDMPINWSALTSLTFGCLASYIFRLLYHQEVFLSMWIDILPVLNGCTNLQRCALMLPSDRGHVITPNTGATMPSLVALHLSGCSDAIDCLLNFIDAPHIQELHYQPLHSKIPAPNIPISPRPPFSVASPLSTFLQTSGATIEVLSVNVPPDTPNAVFHTCLGNTPLLKQLTVGNEFRNHPFLPQSLPVDFTSLEADNAFIFTDFDLRALTPTAYDDESISLCPRLEILRCNNVKCQITEGAVITFLNAKLNLSLGGGGTKFKELSMNMLQLDAPFGGASDMDEDGPLQLFRDACIKLSFSKADYYRPTPPSLSGFTLGYGVDFGD